MVLTRTLEKKVICPRCIEKGTTDPHKVSQSFLARFGMCAVCLFRETKLNNGNH